MDLRSFFAFAALAAMWSAGCGDDDHSGIPLSCQDIIDACHEVDPGTGTIHECHETAHDTATDEACAPVRDMCVAMCEALTPADGAVEDYDGDVDDQDGGHEDHDGGDAEDAGPAPDAGG